MEDDDKGEMVYVYQSDLQVFLDWVDSVVGLSDQTMTERQAEALAALQADASA